MNAGDEQDAPREMELEQATGEHSEAAPTEPPAVPADDTDGVDESTETSSDRSSSEVATPRADDAEASETAPLDALSAPASVAEPSDSEHADAPGADLTDADEPAADADDTNGKVEPPSEEAPVIDSIEPPRGPLAGGTTLVIRGARFGDEPSVLVGSHEGVIASGSQGELSVLVPAGTSAGFVDIAVVLPDGQRALRVHGFHYDPPPEVTQVHPSTVPITGDVSVELEGAGFGEGCAVHLGDAEVMARTVGPTRLRVEVPAHHPGTLSIRVTNPDGQSALLPEGLCFDEGPIIENVSPATALASGDTEVTITGRNFKAGCTLSVLDRHSPAVVQDSAEQLRFVAPAHEAPEAGPLRVTNPDGLSHTAPTQFAYISPRPPTIEGITPADASTAGGKRVTVSGSDFQPGCSVRIGASDATIVRQHAEELHVSVPPAAQPGPVDIVVSNPDGQVATVTAAFTYELPPAPAKIIAIAPNRGFCAGGTHVVITGDNFDEETVLRIGEVQATIEKRTRTELSAIHSTTHDTAEAVAAEITNRERVAVRLERAFVYEQRPAPSVEDVSPRKGPTTGGTRVTIEGANLGSDVTVRVGRERAKLLRARGTTVLEIVTPPRRSPALVDVEVVGPGELSAVSSKAFQYEAHPAPKISSVAPNRCGTSGGAELSITGANFVNGTVVLIERKAVSAVKRVDPTTLEFKAPPGKHGKMIDVTVRNPDGKDAVARRAYAYDERYD